MTRLTLALTISSLLTSVSAFAPVPTCQTSTRIFADVAAAEDAPVEAAAEEPAAIWDPLMLSQLGKNIDTFPNMFPDQQFVTEAEIKHGRMCMLAWTGIWATHDGGLGLGMHIPGMPVCSDWMKAFSVTSKEQPVLTAVVILLIAIAEGESVGHSGDNFRGKSSKVPGNFGLDPFGLKTKLSPEKQARYKQVESANGRAAMIAMASMFAFESIPGSVPLMDIFGAQ